MPTSQPYFFGSIEAIRYFPSLIQYEPFEPRAPWTTSQPFFVAEQFTGTGGRYVPLAETIQGFSEILEGRYDDIPEGLFLNAGGISDVLAKVKDR